MLAFDHWALSTSPEPTIFGFTDLVRVGIGPCSKLSDLLCGLTLFQLGKTTFYHLVYHVMWLHEFFFR